MTEEIKHCIHEDRQDYEDGFPEGTTHVDCGPSPTMWLRINEVLHDYWCDSQTRWITFEGGHNPVQAHWWKI